MSTLKTEKNLKSPKLLPVYNSNIKVPTYNYLITHYAHSLLQSFNTCIIIMHMGFSPTYLKAHLHFFCYSA